ncbi:tight adherence pilus pseudopilin TadF [Candidatus Williamhamiltonella defendens]|nr:tight adherence pilus pseudopilin TadF [Candidatus Hamiltonella defensa]
MFKNMNVFNFFHDKRGGITVELCLVTLFFVLLFFILSTMAQYINTKGRFDSIAYSLSSVLRERTVLYAGQPLLTEAQADQLVRVASELFRDNHMDFNKPGAALVLESLYFEDDPQSPGTNQTQIQNAQTFVRPLSSAQGTPSCSPAESLRAIVERIERTEKRSFSVKKKGRGINHEWIPFYRVTICMPPPDFNLSVFPSHFLPEIKSSSPMMLAR